MWKQTAEITTTKKPKQDALKLEKELLEIGRGISEWWLVGRREVRHNQSSVYESATVKHVNLYN
jgi:hypothetical protein